MSTPAAEIQGFMTQIAAFGLAWVKNFRRRPNLFASGEE
jgi:hypothetical protein